MAMGPGARRGLLVGVLGAVVVLLLIRHRRAGAVEHGRSDGDPDQPETRGGSAGRAEWLRHRGRDVLDSHSERVGTLEEIYVEITGAPDWGVVDTGRLRTSRRFVPLGDAALVDGRVQLPFTRAAVVSAPPLDADAWMTVDEEQTLRAHYNGGG